MFSSDETLFAFDLDKQERTTSVAFSFFRTSYLSRQSSPTDHRRTSRIDPVRPNIPFLFFAALARVTVRSFTAISASTTYATRSHRLTSLAYFSLDLIERKMNRFSFFLLSVPIETLLGRYNAYRARDWLACPSSNTLDTNDYKVC